MTSDALSLVKACCKAHPDSRGGSRPSLDRKSQSPQAREEVSRPRLETVYHSPEFPSETYLKVLEEFQSHPLKVLVSSWGK